MKTAVIASVPHCPCCGFALFAEQEEKVYLGLRFTVFEGSIFVRDAADGILLPFTRAEASILMTLAMLGAGGRVASKNMIYDSVYPNEEPDPKIIDVFVCKIRRKLREHPRLGLQILTHWGQGYALLREQADSRAA